jgi:hypothetical protein
MINLDLGKIFHPSVSELLCPFVPGLFFEICIFLANPQYAQPILKAMGSDRYIQLFVVLFFAFIIGNALLLWVRLLQIQLSHIYLKCLDWKPKVLSWRIKREQAKLPPAQPGQPPRPTSKTWIKLQAARDRQHDREELLRDVPIAWGIAAKQLLKRYGIEMDPLTTWQWGPWQGVLGEPLRPQDWRGSLLVMTMDATGWAGVIALFFARNLRTWSFALLCLFFIVYGLLHNWDLAARYANPISQWRLGLWRVVAELKKPYGNNKSEHESTEPGMS